MTTRRTFVHDMAMTTSTATMSMSGSYCCHSAQLMLLLCRRRRRRRRTPSVRVHGGLPKFRQGLAMALHSLRVKEMRFWLRPSDTHGAICRTNKRGVRNTLQCCTYTIPMFRLLEKRIPTLCVTTTREPRRGRGMATDHQRSGAIGPSHGSESEI